MNFLKALLLRLLKKHGREVLEDVFDYLIGLLGPEAAAARLEAAPETATVEAEPELSEKDSALCDAAVAASGD